MQTSSPGCKGLSYFCVSFLIMLLNVNPILGWEFSRDLLYQKINLNTALKNESQELQDSQKIYPQSKQKSETKAFNLSFFGTLIPVGLGAASLAVDRSGVATLVLVPTGIVVGPSLGYIYAGKSGRGLATAGLRFLLIPGVFLASFATCGWDCGEGDSGYDAAWMILIVGEALVVASAVYDIATVKKAVRKKNQSLGKKNWMIMPKYFSKSGAGGVEIKIKF